MVISLVGPLDENSRPKFQNLSDEISQNYGIKFFIFNFRDVPTIAAEAISSLTQLQMKIRSQKAELRLCSIKPNLKEMLVKKGVVRGLELSDNLAQAIIAFSPQKKGVS